MGKRCLLSGLLLIAIVNLLFAGPVPAQDDNVVESIPLNIGIEGLLRQFQRSFDNTAVDPEEYIVAPGDKFTVYFTSNQIDDIKCEIKASGNLFVKSVGLIRVNRVTLTEAVEKISERIKIIYPKTDFSVQLTGFRIVRINVTGEVNNPGIYYAPAIWRASEVIDMAGGLTPMANVREIKIKGYDREMGVDLVRYNSLGDPRYNPLISNGEVLDVPNRYSAEGFVSIAGLVNKPGTFVYTKHDNLKDLVDFAGGLAGSIDEMEIVVASSEDGQMNRMDGSAEDVYDWQPHPGDNLKLVWKQTRHNFGAVDIFGAVTYPGRYKISNGKFTLADLYNLCGGPDPGGCPEMIQVFRENMDMSGRGILTSEGSIDKESSEIERGALHRRRLSLNPRESEGFLSLELVDGDSVYIPRATGMIMVSGAVVSPGLVKFEEEKDIDYYIEQAGGYGYNADKKRAIVINPYTGGRISAGKTDRLYDGEIVFIPYQVAK